MIATTLYEAPDHAGRTDDQVDAPDASGNTVLHRAALLPDPQDALRAVHTRLNDRPNHAALTQANGDGNTVLDLVRLRIDGEPGTPWASMLGALIQQHLHDPIVAGTPITVPFQRNEEDATPADEDLVAHCLQHGLHGTVRTMLNEAPWYRDLVLWSHAKNPATVDLLVDLGFEASDAGDALDDALMFRKPRALIEKLLDVGAPMGPTALHQALAHPEADALVHRLLQDGADPEELDADGRNALLVAVETGHVNLVQTLLDRDASFVLVDHALAHPGWFLVQTNPDPAVQASVARVNDAVHQAMQQAMDEGDDDTDLEVAPARAHL